MAINKSTAIRCFQLVYECFNSVPFSVESPNILQQRPTASKSVRERSEVDAIDPLPLRYYLVLN